MNYVDTLTITNKTLYGYEVPLNRRQAILKPSATLGAIYLAGLGFHEEAQAFALPLIIGKLFLAFGFGSAAYEIYKTRNYRENVTGLGAAGSYEAEGRLMIPGGSNFGSERWQVAGIDAHAIESKRAFDGERIYPVDTTVSMSDQGDIDVYNRALERFGLRPVSGKAELRKRPVESMRNTGQIIAADRTRIVDAKGNYQETILPVVVAMRGQEPQMFPIREVT